MAIGGTKEPLFVIDTDVENNILYTGQGKNHPGLHKKGLWVDNSEVHWIRPDLSLSEGETMDVKARIRYRQTLEKAKLYQMANELYVIFENEQTAISEGQFVAWYQEDELIGSGVIA